MKAIMHDFFSKTDFLTIQEIDMADLSGVIFFISDNERNYEMMPTGFR